MNKKGQTLALSIMMGIMIFVVGMLIMNFLKPEVTTARSVGSGLNCSYAGNITDGTKLTCLVFDLVIPYWILIIVSAAGGAILGRFL